MTGWESGVYLGGPPGETYDQFVQRGRDQLEVLLGQALTPSSMLCDVGCGALRGGMWVIPLLDTDHYCGVEPNREMLNKGLERFVDPAILALKKPRFDNNDRFDMSVFGERFTHVILRSIWSHTAKSQMELSLDSFCEVAAPGAVMVASYNPVVPGTSDYKGTEWDKGTVHHSFRWIRSVCKSRGLTVRPLARQPVNRQVWLRIKQV